MIGRRTLRWPRNPQARFALTSLAWASAGCALTAALCFVPLFVAFSESAALAREPVHVADEILALDKHLWKIVLGMMAGVAAPAAFLYKKMTGPMVRFRRVFAQVGEGSLPRDFSIRENDYLHAEADAFASMLAALGQRADAIGDAHDSLSREIALLAREVAENPASDPATWEAKIVRLEGLDKELAGAVAGIHREP